MGFNISGQEVVSGVQDPAAMFGIVAAVLVLGFLIAGVMYIYNLLGK